MNTSNFIDIYILSISELKKLMSRTRTRPNEKIWNSFAIKNGLLLSGTLGYISGKGFNKLCRELIKS